MHYSKLPISIDEQIERLRSRGLIVNDEEEAKRYLTNVGYYNTALFKNTPALVKSLDTLREEVERSKETFIKEHKKKYKEDGRFPPAWKTLELTSFGMLSKLYGNLGPAVKAKDIIADEYFAGNHTYLRTWLQSLSQIRNFCAHHSRLWNRNLPGSVKILSNPKGAWISIVPSAGESQYLYIHLCVMQYMLRSINLESTFSSDLKKLISEFPEIDSKALGLKVGWKNEPLWR